MTVGLNTFYRHYLDTQTPELAPYVGEEYFIRDIQTASDSSFCNAIGGLKYYVSENAAFDLKAAYGFGLGGSAGQLFTTTFGISVAF